MPCWAQTRGLLHPSPCRFGFFFWGGGAYSKPQICPQLENFLGEKILDHTRPCRSQLSPGSLLPRPAVSSSPALRASARLPARGLPNHSAAQPHTPPAGPGPHQLQTGAALCRLCPDTQGYVFLKSRRRVPWSLLKQRKAVKSCLTATSFLFLKGTATQWRVLGEGLRG